MPLAPKTLFSERKQVSFTTKVSKYNKMTQKNVKYGEISSFINIFAILNINKQLKSYYTRTITQIFETKVEMKRVTLKDIAAKLGISYSTVSRALADDIHIKLKTRQLVQSTAREMGYRPNPIAMNLKKGRSNTIGVIVPEMVTPNASYILRGIQDVCIKAGIRVIIFNSDYSSDREKEGLEMMENFMVDGIIIDQVDYRKNREEITRLLELELPMVFYNRLQPDFDVTQVRIDDYGKGCEVMEHLYAQGKRNIVHIVGPDGIYNSVERQRAYRDTMAKYGLPIEEYKMSDVKSAKEDGEEIAEKLVASGKPFDAVYACTDTVAIGLMNRLRLLGKQMPEDVAVTGFSGTILSELVYPKLTTVEPQLREMGVSATEAMLEEISNPSMPNKDIVVGASIVVRGSTDAAAEA